jgi:hypothetical protein
MGSGLSSVRKTQISETKVLEAAAALDWFLDSLPISKEDGAALNEVAKHYGVESTRLVFRGALSRAKDEFRRALGDAPPNTTDGFVKMLREETR